MIKLNNLHKKYKREIFNDLDLNINSPGVYLLIGESGSGKSTLLNIISGLDNKYTGSVEISYNDYGSTISLVNQSNSLIKRFTVRDNILLAQNIEDIDKINYYAKLLGVYNLLDKKVKHLSAGERQRVALIKGVINEPNILLLDEPTSHLDDKTTSDFINLVNDLQALGMIILITTHDHRLINSFDNLYKIKDKKLEIVKNNQLDNELKIPNTIKNNKITKYIIMNLKTQKLIYFLYLVIIAISCMFFIGSISNFLDVYNDYADKTNDLFSEYSSYYIDDNPGNGYDVYYYGDYIVEDVSVQDADILKANEITADVPVAISVSSYTSNNDYKIVEGNAPSEINEIIVSEDLEAIYQKNNSDTLVNKTVTIIENPLTHDSHNGEHHEFVPTEITITGTYKTYEYAYPMANDFDYNGLTVTTNVYGVIQDPMSETFQYTIHTNECNTNDCITKTNYYKYSDFIYLFDSVISQSLVLFVTLIILFFLMSLLILIPRKNEFSYLLSIGIKRTKILFALIIEIITLYTIAFTGSIIMFKIVSIESLGYINLYNIVFIYFILATCLLSSIFFIILTTRKRKI